MGFDRRQLGSTGLEVGALGMSSSFGAPAEAFEEAFDRGCNYFTWGTFIKGRNSKMKTAMKNIIASGKRDQLIIATYSYAHNAQWMSHSTRRALAALGTDHLDVIILGYHNKQPWKSVLARAVELKDRGITRFIGVSSHNRKLFPELAREGVIDIFHVRYNAAHRGAETEVFPALPAAAPGLVTFTATRWGKLLKQNKMPPGASAPSAADCYRFALSHPKVDVCMAGTRDLEQMRHALTALDRGPMSADELARMRKIGDHIYGKKK